MSAKNYAKKTRSQKRSAAKTTTRKPSVAFRLTTALERIAELLTPRITIEISVRIPAARPAARFTKVSAAGALLPDTATEWEGVLDSSTGLVWGRKLLPGEANWKDSLKKASEAKLCGGTARAPTIQERLSIVDYDRADPAIDTNYFDSSEPYAWEWTSTPAKSPSVCAWVVLLGDGATYRDAQAFRFRVRAVLAGQSLGL
jgi:hypothetical protein